MNLLHGSLSALRPRLLAWSMQQQARHFPGGCLSEMTKRVQEMKLALHVLLQVLGVELAKMTPARGFRLNSMPAKSLIWNPTWSTLLSVKASNCLSLGLGRSSLPPPKMLKSNNHVSSCSLAQSALLSCLLAQSGVLSCLLAPSAVLSCLQPLSSP